MVVVVVVVVIGDSNWLVAGCWAVVGDSHGTWYIATFGPNWHSCCGGNNGGSGSGSGSGRW